MEEVTIGTIGVFEEKEIRNQANLGLPQLISFLLQGLLVCPPLLISHLQPTAHLAI